MVILLNSNGKHGEARLLSHQKHDRNINFLKQMREQFVEEFGEKEKENYILCMFSYYVPCTIKGHKCAKLKGEFSDKTGKQVIISYDQVYNATNLNKALQVMESSKNINII